ncbi:prolyl oligopeptidase family serine peptidase [Nonomuraea sp. NPDC003709]|uniref:prolyl oligopeptidase family serine peptidase n=1 Tax=Nonomuraea sp. NPDC003709 TaxID=3154450 RepID=UPI0033B20121
MTDHDVLGVRFSCLTAGGLTETPWVECADAPSLMANSAARPVARYLVVRGRSVYRLVDGGSPGHGRIERAVLDDDGSIAGPWAHVLTARDLGGAESSRLVWRGVEILCPPHAGWSESRALVTLEDAHDGRRLVAEADLVKQRWMGTAEGGFRFTGEAVSATWRGHDSVLVTDRTTGPGGAALWRIRTVRRHDRVEDAYDEAMFRDDAASVTAYASADGTLWARVRSRDGRRVLVMKRPAAGWWRVRPVRGYEAYGVGNWVFVLRNGTRDTARGVVPGTLLACKPPATPGGTPVESRVLFRPEAGQALARLLVTGEDLALSVLDHGTSEIRLVTLGSAGEPSAVRIAIPAGFTPQALVAGEDGTPFVTASGFTTPARLVRLDTPLSTSTGPAARVLWATADDGVRVPYTLHQAGSGAPRPTVVLVYGGFGAVIGPRHMPHLESAWIARGGNVVIANVRGGGELGPEWASAGFGPRVCRAFADLHSVVDALVATGVARPEQIGLLGASYGALVASGALVSSPERFGAAVLQSGVYDLEDASELAGGPRLVTKLGLGRTTRQKRAGISPTAMLDRRLPPTLVMAAEDDAIVDPEHSRRFARALRRVGSSSAHVVVPVGGHYFAGPNVQAVTNSLTFAFFRSALPGLPQPGADG